jgi:hypothetical protein
MVMVRATSRLSDPSLRCLVACPPFRTNQAVWGMCCVQEIHEKLLRLPPVLLACIYACTYKRVAQPPLEREFSGLLPNQEQALVERAGGSCGRNILLILRHVVSGHPLLRLFRAWTHEKKPAQSIFFIFPYSLLFFPLQGTEKPTSIIKNCDASR